MEEKVVVIKFHPTPIYNLKLKLLALADID
jgi:hypothetical protein